ncbi:MAG: hypothetical protein AAGD14_03210 [Planctomycetota bacterium]
MELIPATLVSIGVGIAVASDHGAYLIMERGLVASLAFGPVFAGFWQGMIDRLHLRDPFHRHRPVAPRRMQAVRSLAGACSVVLMFVAMAATTLVVRLNTSWERLTELRSQIDPDEVMTAGHFVTLLLHALAAWALLRVSIATGGVAAAVATTIAFSSAFIAGGSHLGPNQAISLAVILGCSLVFQGLRLRGMTQ